MIKSLRFFVLWLVTAFLAVTAQAHQQKAAFTDIFVNPRAGMVEVVHSFILHDAEAALFEATGMTGDLYRDPSVQAAFATYAVDRFELTNDAGDAAPLALTLLGFEVADGRLLIYQEAPVPDDLHMFKVQAGALRDVWPDQVNTVNVRRGDTLRTLTFTGSESAKVAVLASTP
ncbi:MAG: DUF6702 family protein [Pseudomonadota bacterium]